VNRGRTQIAAGSMTVLGIVGRWCWHLRRMYSKVCRTSETGEPSDGEAEVALRVSLDRRDG